MTNLEIILAYLAFVATIYTLINCEVHKIFKSGLRAENDRLCDRLNALIKENTKLIHDKTEIRNQINNKLHKVLTDNGKGLVLNDLLNNTVDYVTEEEIRMIQLFRDTTTGEQLSEL